MTNRDLAYIVKNQNPLLLPAQNTVRDACDAMWTRKAGSVLVVDDGNRLIGIFTGRDAVRVLSSLNMPAETALEEAMTSNPVSIRPENSAIDALRAMSDGGFRHVPITTREGHVLGVVSRGDFKGMELEAFQRRASGVASRIKDYRGLTPMIADRPPFILSETNTVQDACKTMWRTKAGSTLVVDDRQHLSGIFTGRDAVHMLAEGEDAGALPLAQAMTRNPITVSSSGNAVEALRIMNDRGFRHLPVVDSGKIVGIVSRSDFTGVEIDRLEEEEHLAECIW